MLMVENANYIKDYKIYIRFNNQKEGVLDLRDFLNNTKLKPFAVLKDKNRFKNFKVDYTLKWEDLDLAPEYLFFETFKNDKQFQSQFKEWGYLK